MIKNSKESNVQATFSFPAANIFLLLEFSQVRS